MAQRIRVDAAYGAPFPRSPNAKQRVPDIGGLRRPTAQPERAVTSAAFGMCRRRGGTFRWSRLRLRTRARRPRYSGERDAPTSTTAQAAAMALSLRELPVSCPMCLGTVWELADEPDVRRRVYAVWYPDDVFVYLFRRRYAYFTQTPAQTHSLYGLSTLATSADLRSAYPDPASVAGVSVRALCNGGKRRRCLRGREKAVLRGHRSGQGQRAARGGIRPRESPPTRPSPRLDRGS